MRILVQHILVFFLALALYPTTIFSLSQSYDSVRVEVEFQVSSVFGLNTKYAEFSPVWYHTELIFASDREWNYNNLGESNWSNNSTINLFKVKVDSYSQDSVVFKKPVLFNQLLIGSNHVGPIAFHGLNEAILSKVSKKKHKKLKLSTLNPQLYYLKFDGKKILKEEKLAFSDPNFSYSQPSFSADGNQVFFVSDYPCEFSGTNIFVSNRTAEGWSAPELVANVNTDSDEMFPVIQGRKMYFSSNKSEGLGGLDLYVSEFVNGNWSAAESLGETINTSFDDFSMVFNPNGKTGYFSSNRDLGNGNDDIYSFKLIEKVIVVNQYNKIQGQFEYIHLDGSPDKMEVILLDESGNIVSKTNTDQNGNFVFNYLPTDQKYTIKVNDDGDVVLTLFNGDGNAILLSNENGEFVFRKLSHDGSSFMSLIDENDIDLSTGLVDFKGQFKYQKLKTQNPGGMKVYLVDENGDVVMQTTTDEYGNFIFKQLPTDQNYIVKIDDDSDMILMVFNNVDHLVAMLTNGNNGTFIYRMLETDNKTNINLITEEEGSLVFRKERMVVSGEFLFENLAPSGQHIKFDILDNQGDLLVKGQTAKDFTFRYDDLPLLEDLIFKLDEDSPLFNSGIKLRITNRMNESLIVLDKDESGMYTYKRIVSSKYNITDVKELETADIVKEEHTIKISNFTLYYPNNGFSISEKFIPKLDSLVSQLKAYDSATIQVNGHASSLASDAYNMNLSIKRMNKVVMYLQNKGIPVERIFKKAFGESQLVNFCEDDKACEEEMHRLNRRTELKIIIHH